MSNELIHASVGTTMTQSEFEAVGLHVLNSQATGDLIYASSAAQLTRLGIGTAGDILVTSGGIPAWVNTGITLNNSVGKGTWTASGTWTIPAVTLGGVISGVSNTNYFDCGSSFAKFVTTSSNSGLRIESSGDPHGPACTLAMTHNTPEATAAIAQFIFEGYDGATPAVAQNLSSWLVAYTNVGDGTEAVKLSMNLWDAGATNLAMELSGAGGLSVDADIGTADDPVALFDKYDDALVLRQGIQQNNRELLVDMGVLEHKDTGSGYMMKVQPMVRLLAGGIYQTRQMLEDTRSELLTRLEVVERKLLEG